MESIQGPGRRAWETSFISWPRPGPVPPREKVGHRHWPSLVMSLARCCHRLGSSVTAPREALGLYGVALKDAEVRTTVGLGALGLLDILEKHLPFLLPTRDG